MGSLLIYIFIMIYFYKNIWNKYDFCPSNKVMLNFRNLEGKYFMKKSFMKSKFAKTFALGVCLATFSTNIALADGMSQQLVPSNEIQVDYRQLMDFGGPDIPVYSDIILEPRGSIDVQIISDISEPVLESDNQLIRVQVNGEFLQLDVEPFIENGRTLLPLRGVMEKLGAEVRWHSEDMLVEVVTEDISIKLVIGEDTAKVTRNIDGELKEESIKLEVPAKILKDRTFIPGRFVSETLGASVDWDKSLRAMIIKTETSNDTFAVESLVKNFGEKLKMVSLLAPEDILNQTMGEYYSKFVSPELLDEWKNDPQNAPGRLTSSPWPECIEIIDINKLSKEEYEVKGEIIEVSSTETANNEITVKQPITLSIKKIDDNWLITNVNIGTFEEVSSIVYNNNQYGFNFNLPQSWEEYTIIESEWEGSYIENPQNSETGPMITIRHPQWTLENKRQDIPIMVFKFDQWKEVQQEKLRIGAAPIGPKELGRNEEYVFALPARYNFEFLEGYEEVERIIENNSLQPIEINN